MSELGLRFPTDDRHRRAYPLTPPTAPDKPTPVVLGIWWYAAFDRPERDAAGRWWIGRDTNWGHRRGGHAVCLKPPALVDHATWWRLMDQGQEGACVGYAATRCMMLLNRARYAPRWLYRRAQAVDEWHDTPPEEGTSVRAAFDVLRDEGHVRLVGGVERQPPEPRHGVAANRWAASVEAILACLHQGPAAGYVTVLNSRGSGYPHFVRLPLESLELLLREGGEAAMPTDR